MRFFSRYLLLACLIAFSSNASAQQRMTRSQYIDQYRELAIRDQQKYGIPASIKMAQAILESDCGNSRLAVNANNHFGIKCKSDWKGQTIRHDDDAPQECFRKYGSANESFRDHSEFLCGSSRYAGLFKLDVTDYQGWARGLKAAGYATNPQYAELLIRIIEEEELFLLDQGKTEKAKRAKKDEPTMAELAPEDTPRADPGNYAVASEKNGYAVHINNGSDFVISRPGDTYKSIAKATGTSAKKLRKFNEVPQDAEPFAGQQVYLHAKANRAANGRLLHLAREDETIWSISQLYGIKAKKLARINGLPLNAPVSPGLQVRLL